MASSPRSNANASSMATSRAAWSRSTSSSVSLWVAANGETFARQQISLDRRRPMPAIARWSRRKPCTRIDL